MIRTVGFFVKLYTIDDVTKYHGIPISQYFMRQYIIVGHFLILRIPIPCPFLVSLMKFDPKLVS